VWQGMRVTLGHTPQSRLATPTSGRCSEGIQEPKVRDPGYTQILSPCMTMLLSALYGTSLTLPHHPLQLTVHLHAQEVGAAGGGQGQGDGLGGAGGEAGRLEGPHGCTPAAKGLVRGQALFTSCR
jgi:hypothetical protein